MIIKLEIPPMYEEIDKAFNIKGKPVIFTWGNFIYNPEKVKVTRELYLHEEVHSEQQKGTELDIALWWGEYIKNPQFRLDMELPAHRAEYGAYFKRHGGQRARTNYLIFVAQRLSSAL